MLREALGLAVALLQAPASPPVLPSSITPLVTEILQPGPVHICQTGDSLHVRASGTQIYLSGGLLCDMNKPGTLWLDTRTCEMRGTVSHMVSITCAPAPDPYTPRSVP